MIVYYSSRTGNTEKVAVHLAEHFGWETEVLTETCCAPQEDQLVVGFWIDKGRPDARAEKFLDSLRNKTLALFFTLGADAQGEYARALLGKIVHEAERNGNRVMASYCCQGKVDPRLQARRQQADSGERDDQGRHWADHKEADAHPNANDLAAAVQAMASFAQSEEKKHA